MLFENREEAGAELGKHLKDNNFEADLVLAIPQGGLLVGREVANMLNAPLDVITARKICSPGDPERPMGAVTSGGVRWLNDELIQELGLENSYIEKKTEEQRSKALDDLRFLRGSEELPEVKGKNVILIDDGIMTGSIAAACIKYLRTLEVKHVTFATPVGPKRSYEGVRDETDDFVVLKTLRYFGPVSAFYRDFNQVSIEKARSYMV